MQNSLASAKPGSRRSRQQKGRGLQQVRLNNWKKTTLKPSWHSTQNRILCRLRTAKRAAIAEQKVAEAAAAAAAAAASSRRGGGDDDEGDGAAIAAGPSRGKEPARNVDDETWNPDLYVDHV